jgi:hypothetical protein
MTLDELEAAMPQADERMRRALDSAVRLLEDTEDIGVEGIGQGATERGEPCILVMVASRTPELEKRIPESIEGVPVEIVETGPFTAEADRPND